MTLKSFNLHILDEDIRAARSALGDRTIDSILDKEGNEVIQWDCQCPISQAFHRTLSPVANVISCSTMVRHVPHTHTNLPSVIVDIENDDKGRFSVMFWLSNAMPVIDRFDDGFDPKPTTIRVEPESDKAEQLLMKAAS